MDPRHDGPLTGTAAGDAPIDPAVVPPEPWRNGAGLTRPLIEETDWRLSLAELTGDAPFSTFPGLDRLFVALGPLTLRVSGRVHELAAGDQLRFAGEEPTAVTLAQPTRALNLMTRRGRCRGEVVLRKATADPAPATVSVLLGDLVADVHVHLLPRDAS